MNESAVMLTLNRSWQTDSTATGYKDVQEIVPELIVRGPPISLAMAKIDTSRPLESVQEALNLFDRRSDQIQRRFSTDTNEQEEIDALTKELASCRAQLEAMEDEKKQDDLKLEALEEAMQKLSERYGRACEGAHGRMAELEADNARIAGQQSEAAAECRALRGELAGVRASSAAAARDVEAMGARVAAEREASRKALARIMELNEAVLSSAVAAIRAEEERSVFFQEITLEFFNSDRNLEVIRRQVEMIESLERELLAKTTDIDYLWSELKQAREEMIFMPPQEKFQASDSESRTVEDQNPQAEFAFHPPGAFAVAVAVAVSETSRENRQVVATDGAGAGVEGEVPEDVAGERDVLGAGAMVSDSTMLTRIDSDQQDGTDGGIDCSEDEKKSGNQDQEQGTAPTSMDMECRGVSDQHMDISFESDFPVEVCEINRSDGKDECEVKNQELAREDLQESAGDYRSIQLDEGEGHIKNAVPEIALEGREEPSREDLQSVHSDEEEINVVAMAGDAAGNQEPHAEATAPSSTVREGNAEAAETCSVTEIVEQTSKDGGAGGAGGEFYTKEIEQGQGKKVVDEGYVLVEKAAARGDGGGGGALKEKLEAAQSEISELRFSLEEAVRRAELAEEAKAALERELREEIQRKQRATPKRRAAPPEDARTPASEGSTPMTPLARLRPTPSRTPRSAAAARGDEMPSAGCLTLGKVLNMKYK